MLVFLEDYCIVKFNHSAHPLSPALATLMRPLRPTQNGSHTVLVSSAKGLDALGSSLPVAPQQQLSELAGTCPSLNSCGLELSIESLTEQRRQCYDSSCGLDGSGAKEALGKLFPWPNNYGMPQDATLLSRTC